MKIGDRVVVHYPGPMGYDGLKGMIVETQKYIGLPYRVAFDNGRPSTWFGPVDLRKEAT